MRTRPDDEFEEGRKTGNLFHLNLELLRETDESMPDRSEGVVRPIWRAEINKSNPSTESRRCDDRPSSARDPPRRFTSDDDDASRQFSKFSCSHGITMAYW